jgi:hypothetical protein
MKQKSGPGKAPAEQVLQDAPDRRVSEASVYRLLKAHDLIASPAYVVTETAKSSRTRPQSTSFLKRPTLVQRKLSL